MGECTSWSSIVTAAAAAVGGSVKLWCVSECLSHILDCGRSPAQPGFGLLSVLSFPAHLSCVWRLTCWTTWSNYLHVLQMNVTSSPVFRTTSKQLTSDGICSVQRLKCDSNYWNACQLYCRCQGNRNNNIYWSKNPKYNKYAQIFLFCAPKCAN